MYVRVHVILLLGWSYDSEELLYISFFVSLFVCECSLQCKAASQSSYPLQQHGRARGPAGSYWRAGHSWTGPCTRGYLGVEPGFAGDRLCAACAWLEQCVELVTIVNSAPPFSLGEFGILGCVR